MRGHIRKRAKDSWTVVVELPRDPETGKRRQKWVTVKGTKRDAERVLAETIAEIERGTYIEPAKMTVAEYLDRWSDACRAGVRLSTHLGRLQAIRHWKAVLGSVPLARLTPLDVQRALACLPEGLSDSSKRTYFTVLKAGLSQGVKWGLLPRNPAQGVKPPARKAREIRVWDEEQAVRFLEVARSTRYYALFYLALATGMRIGELLGLAWDDVDLDGGAIQVRRAIATCVAHAGAPAWQEPKTTAGRRRVPIGAQAVEVLRQHRRAQLEERLRAGPDWRDYGLVFCNQKGGPLFNMNVHKAFTACCKRAGVPRIRLHDLRHTHATLLLRQGVHPKVVSERLGHASVKITLDIYSHVLPDTQEEAVRATERALAAGRVSNPLANCPRAGRGGR